MKRLVFHFGVHRTGSTTIQSVMKKNRGILRSHGILYPNLYDMQNHIKIPWMIKKGDLTAKELEKELANHDEDIIDTIVVSAEDFCLLNDFEFLRYFSKSYQVEVVIYLKEQISWLESWYNQHVKWPWDKKFSSCSPEEFFERLNNFYWIDYSKTLSNISGVIGDKNIHVERVGGKGVKDTVQHFFNILGVDTKRLHSVEMRNESLSSASLEVIRRLDLFDLNAPSRNKILKALKDIPIEEDDGSKHIFNNEQRKKIYDAFRNSNQRVSEKYFNGELLFGELQRSKKDPVKIDEYTVYKKYIPQLCKKVTKKG